MQRFAEVSSFYELSLAELAKAKLESENIFCFLHTKHHISMKWYIAQALGGVRLYVKTEDKEKAKTVLNTDESELLSAIEFPEPNDQDLCRNCHSENLKKIDHRYTSCYLILITGLPFIFWGSYYKCNDCGHNNYLK
jgi:hypothetical protein